MIQTQEVMGHMSRRQLDGYCGIPTKVEIEVIYVLALDVLCDPAGDPQDDHASLATRAVQAVRNTGLPDIRHPETGAAVSPEIWYFGEVHKDCPKTGYGVTRGEKCEGRKITREVRR